MSPLEGISGTCEWNWKTPVVGEPVVKLSGILQVYPCHIVGASKWATVGAFTPWNVANHVLPLPASQRSVCSALSSALGKTNPGKNISSEVKSTCWHRWGLFGNLCPCQAASCTKPSLSSFPASILWDRELSWARNFALNQTNSAISFQNVLLPSQ